MRNFLATATLSLALAAPANAAGLAATTTAQAVGAHRTDGAVAVTARSLPLSYAQARGLTWATLMEAYTERVQTFAWGYAAPPCRRQSRSAFDCWGYLAVHGGQPVTDASGAVTVRANGTQIYTGDKMCWVHLRVRLVGQRLTRTVDKTHADCEVYHE